MTRARHDTAQAPGAARGFVGPRTDLDLGSADRTSHLEGQDIITAYASELRRSLAGRRDVDDLVDEVVDHLQESAERLQRAGATPASAAAESVARFGDREVVARAYRTALPGGAAMPTLFTRAAGVAGLLAAGAAVVFALLHVLDVVQVYRGRFSGAFGDDEWSAACASLLVLSVLFVLGLAVRTGSTRSPWFALVVLALAAAVAVGYYAWWAVPIWGSLISLGALAAAARTHRRSLTLDGGAVWAMWLLVAAWPAGMAVLVGLEPYDIGRVDVYGNHVVTALAAALTTTALLVPAAGRLGWWMAREDAAAPRPLQPLAHA